MTASGAGHSLRIDRLLVCLRFARTRSAALTLIESRALRRNRNHVLRASEAVRIGDVLTVMAGGHVRVIEITALPTRRGPPAEAREHYRELDQMREVGVFGEVDGDGLDRKGQMTITASTLAARVSSADPEDRI